MMEKKTYVLGHRNPDTDSICSAIAYAELKRKQGMNAIAGRLGEPNKETEFVLNYFAAELPEIVETVKKQVSDLNIDVVPSVSPGIPVRTTWNIMKKTNVKALHSLSTRMRGLIGVVTLFRYYKEQYMDAIDNNIIAVSNTHPLQNIADTLEARVVSGDQGDF